MQSIQISKFVKAFPIDGELASRSDVILVQVQPHEAALGYSYDQKEYLERLFRNKLPGHYNKIVVVWGSVDFDISMLDKDEAHALIDALVKVVGGWERIPSNGAPSAVESSAEAVYLGPTEPPKRRRGRPPKRR